MHLLVELINYIEPKNDHIKNLKNKIKEYGKNIIEIQKKSIFFLLNIKKRQKMDMRIMYQIKKMRKFLSMQFTKG